MDGKLWNEVYRVVMTIDYTTCETGGSCYHSDRTIVLVFLRAVADAQPVSWACDPDHWAGLREPPSWPRQPTMSRRLRSPGVVALLQAIVAWLDSYGPEKERTIHIDGRALAVNAFSKDRDARWGYATKGFARGYKIHAIWGSGPVPLAWQLCSLNVSEPKVARHLVPGLRPVGHRCYLVGDRAYDSNPLHAVSASRGDQLLAPQKRRGRALGHGTHHASRLTSLRMLETGYGRRLYRRRTAIERQFGNMAIRPEGLDQLPAHVRRIPRVRQFVNAKLILNGFRILKNKNQLQLQAP